MRVLLPLHPFDLRATEALAPVWAELGTRLKGKVKVGKVDATENG